MKQLYKGPIHNLKIYSVNKHISLESTIVIKDSLFYKNRLGKFINFEYNTVLPSKIEAETNLLEIARIHKTNNINSNCIYANNQEMEPYKLVSKKEFKTLKKSFKSK